jgi:meso-butanediol dehydrogenase/(S,S)-butanediol dehydrogenase/diacetyl reductase
MIGNRYQGKVALLTGAASGIGLATTERLAREGAKILACDINEALLVKEVARLTEQGLAITAQRVDVTDPASVQAAVAAVIAKHGKLDFLGNIAGILPMGLFADIKAETWSQAFRVNVDGVFHFCQAAMPHLLATKGNIVNIASVAGVVGIPYGVAYSATKGAVLMLSKALAVEYATRDVRVNAVCPGHVLTPMTANPTPPSGVDFALFGRLTPLMQPAADPKEIAGIIAYLGSDEARFVTGAQFTIDGGQTAI